jgi:rhodanese-related sulfurtransferase
MRRKLLIFSVFVMIFCAFCSCGSNSEKYGEAVENENFRVIDSQGFDDIIENEDYFLIDVREEGETEAGIIPGATVIPMSKFSAEMKNYDLPKDKFIIIYCASGARSRKAAEKLCDDGYKNVYDFGGIENYSGELEIS